MSSSIPFPKTFAGPAIGGPGSREEVTGMFPVARLSISAVAGPLRGKRFAFDGGPFVIGRAATCTVSIPSEGVSRNHARIEYGNGGYWLIPDKTVNGTRVNDALIQGPTQLAPADRITIHDTAFVVVFGEPDPEAELAALKPVAARATPMPGTASRPASIAGPGIPSGPFPDPIAPITRLDTQPSRPPTMMPAYAPPAEVLRVKWPAWIAVGLGLIVLVVGVVAVTVRLIQPAPAGYVVQTAPAPTPNVTVTPAPAATAPEASVALAAARPAPVPANRTAPVVGTPPTAPVAAPEHAGVLEVETARVVAEEPGSIIDVVAVGAVIARGAPVAHHRLYSAESEQKREQLRELERKYGDSPEHADFIAQARKEYSASRNRREVRPIIAKIGGTITRVAVKDRDSVRKDDVVAELSVARLRVPATAVEGAAPARGATLAPAAEGERCTAELVAAGRSLSGVLLPPTAGSTDRTLELEGLPDGMAPGQLGVVRVRCAVR